MTAPEHRLAVQPHLAATAMMLGGWVSWEMVRFIDEAALQQDKT